MNDIDMQAVKGVVVGFVVGVSIAVGGMFHWVNNELAISSSTYGAALTLELQAKNTTYETKLLIKKINSFTYADVLDKLQEQGWSDNSSSKAATICTLMSSGEMIASGI